MAAGDLTSAANVKAQRNIQGSSSDAVLGNLITQASAFITDFCGRSFVSAISVSEIRDGGGKCELLLASRPVVSVQSLAIDANPIPAQVADGQPGYFVVDAAVLSLVGYTFRRARKNVRVTYTAGFSAVPKDLEQACIELVWSAYDRVPRGPDKTTESFPAGGMVVSWKPADLPAYAARVIDKYQDKVPV